MQADDITRRTPSKSRPSLANLRAERSSRHRKNVVASHSHEVVTEAWGLGLQLQIITNEIDYFLQKYEPKLATQFMPAIHEVAHFVSSEVLDLGDG